MEKTLHRLTVILGTVLMALVLSGVSAWAEGTEPAEPAKSKAAQAQKAPGAPGPRAVHFGPARRGQTPGMRNGPVPIHPNRRGPDGRRAQRRHHVTPYGDFCPLCTNYGIGRKAVGMDHALEAMRDYFKNRGFEIKNVKGRGRFLKAEVFKDGQLVDKVLFDRRTGRIRSIY